MTLSAQAMPFVKPQFFNANGVPLAGGSIYTYIATTTTPQATYTDPTAATPNANPIVLDSAGRANVYLSTTVAYKFVAYDSASNLQWTEDNIWIVNPDSIDLTKINGSIAGIALDQDAGGALDVQVDNVTMEVNESNQLAIKSVPTSAIPSTSKMEVLLKYMRDYSCNGLVESIPQYEWTSPTLLSNPTSLPGGDASVAKWSHNGEFLAVGCDTGTPNLIIYQKTALGFINIGTYNPGAIFDISWSPCGDFLAVVYTGTPCITIFQRFGNSFVVLPTPASVPTGPSKRGIAISFSPNSDYLAFGWVGSSGSIGTIMYQRGSPVSTALSGTIPLTTNANSTTTSAGLGLWEVALAAASTNVTGTATLPGSAVATTTLPGTTFTDITSSAGLSGIGGPFSWSFDSSYFAALDTTTGLIDVFEIENGVFTGITGPNVSAYTPIIDFAFSPDGNLFAVSTEVTPFVLLFGNPANVFQQFSNPATLPPGIAAYVNWSANSEYLLVGDQSGSSPYMTIYQVTNPTGTPVFTAQASPGTLPAGSVTRAQWSQTKQYLALAMSTAPYLQIYETASVLPANALLFTRGIPNV